MDGNRHLETPGGELGLNDLSGYRQLFSYIQPYLTCFERVAAERNPLAHVMDAVAARDKQAARS